MTAATPDDDENNRMAEEKGCSPEREEKIVARFQKYQIDSNLMNAMNITDEVH